MSHFMTVDLSPANHMPPAGSVKHPFTAMLSVAGGTTERLCVCVLLFKVVV